MKKFSSMRRKDSKLARLSLEDPQLINKNEEEEKEENPLN